MKQLLIFLTAIFIVFASLAQPAKKAASSKTPVTIKAIPKLKAPFLKQTFLLDSAIFSESSITRDSKSEMKLNIRLKAIPTAVISITDFTATPIAEIIKNYKEAYDKYILSPNSTGYTYISFFSGGSNLHYKAASITTLEYKAIYNGTYTQQQLAKAMSKMPAVRKMEGGKIVNTKPVNEFDTDENNRIIRHYMLPYTQGSDKGFMLLSYEANFGEDKKNDGPKILQTLLDGISPMKVNEYISFTKINDKKFLFDFALPAGATGVDGHYSYTVPVTGKVSVTDIINATTGYSSVLEKYNVGYGTITNKSSIEQYKLTNGISIFKQVFTIEKKDDGYTSVWYQVVTVLVPDKKLIKKPLLFTLTSFVSDKGEINSINNFILNSISPVGTLTRLMIEKIKDSQ